ncbi:MAG TPA: DUF3224 domain-containing protein [Candidatus Angelobacter sp.]
MHRRSVSIQFINRLGIAVISFVLIGVVSRAFTNSAIGFKELTMHATGTFEVKLAPQTDDKNGDAALGRMTIDKQFHGDLEGTSKGQMLTGMTEVKGSAGYVAIEKVTGTLKGRSGTFILQHTGIMDRGKPQLKITVVPDSGTGQLVGITGTFNVIITNGKHSYEFDYTLPEAQ